MTQNNICNNNCNNCIHLARREAVTSKEFENVYCTKEKTIKLIEYRIKKDGDVKKPFWCPVEEIKKVKVKIENGEKLTNGEKKTMLMNHTPFIAWEDIEQDQIYHIPSLLGEKRKDVLVTWKGEYSCTFKNLTKGNNATETIYPSTLESRFFVKHKLKKVKVN